MFKQVFLNKLANQKAEIDTHLLKCYTQAVYLGRLDHTIFRRIGGPPIDTHL